MDIKVYRKLYREKHREHLIETSRKWRATHPEELKRSRRRYNETHKEQNKEARKKYRETHPERVREQARRLYSQNRLTGAHYFFRKRTRARKAGIPFSLTKKEFTTWFSKQSKTCFYCKRELTRSHTLLIGLSVDRLDSTKGYELNNIAFCCRRCNMMKGNWLTAEQMLDAVQRYSLG